MEYTTSRNKQIDLLRGVAVLGIVAVHTSQYFSSGSTIIDNLLSAGRFGVQLFFLISAYSLSISWYKRSKKSTKYKIFYIKRLEKIIPLFYVFVAAYIIFYQLFNLSLVDIIKVLSFQFIWFPSSIVNFLPGSWSIGLEVLFYLFFPLLIILFVEKKNYLIFFLISFCVNSLLVEPILKNFLLENNTNISNISNYLYLYPLNQFPVFILGLYIFFTPSFKFYKYELRVILLAGSVLIFNQLLTNSLYKNTGILFYLVIIFLAIFFRFTLRLNSQRYFYFDKIGKFSYEIYFFHFVVLKILDNIFSQIETLTVFMLAFTATLFLSFNLAKIFDYLVSRPIRNLFVSRFYS